MTSSLSRLKSMSQHQKQKERSARAMVAELDGMDANDFEVLAYALSELIEGRPLIHRGLSNKGRPAGYSSRNHYESASRKTECRRRGGDGAADKRRSVPPGIPERVAFR